MSDQPENLILIYLRRIDARLERMEEDVRDLKYRMTLVEEGMGRITQSYAGLQLRMDRIENRLDRIERRLDLQDAHP